MAENTYSREDCLRLLCAKREELLSGGVERLPQRSDFADGEVVAIKARLGPWPRALEAAGLKEPRNEDRLKKNREKRRRARRRAREAKKRENSGEGERNE